MTTVTIDQFQRDLKAYIQCVEAGETLVIVEADGPVAEIRPIGPKQQYLRPYAVCAGEFRVPEDFDAPLPDDIIAQFQGL